MKKLLFCSIIIVVFICCFSMSCFAYTDPTFPGFPQGPAYLIDNEFNQQWIHNTPYGGIIGVCWFNNSLSDNRILQINNVTFTRYTISYDISIMGYQADSLDIYLPYWVDPSLPDYSVGVEVSCDAPIWTSELLHIPRGLILPSDVTFYTYKPLDSLGVSQYTVPNFVAPVDGFDSVHVQCLNFTNSNIFHCYITFLYCEPYGSGSVQPTGSLDFWHLGQNTNFSTLASTVHNVHANLVIGEVYRNVTSIFTDSPLHMALLWLLVAVSGFSMVYEMLFHG